MDGPDVLRRLSTTLRSDIGPAIEDEYTRTQAFMASVILEKVARSQELGPRHQAAEQADLDRLHSALKRRLAESTTAVPDGLATALAAARQSMTVAALGPVVAELYRWGPSSTPAAAAALDLIRPVLRADIDRRMEIAR